MNLTIHPSQWFHHGPTQGEHPAPHRIWHLLRNETFWAVAIMLLVLGAMIAITLMFGHSYRSMDPSMPLLPPTFP